MGDITAKDLQESLEVTQSLLRQLPVKAFEPEQLDLLDDGSEGIELATLDKPTKHYTAEQLDQRVVVRDTICRMLADGIGIIRIARTLRKQGIQIGERSIMALRDRRPELVAIQKRQLSVGLARVLGLALERYEDALVNNTIAPAQIPIAFGIFSDKKAMVDGDASLIVEHRHQVTVSAEGFAARLAALKSARSADSPSTVLHQKPQ